MELKNAAAVCLISFFSATLVLLIARALDLQMASELKPELTRIADELEALRGRSGLPEDQLIVYCFHGNTRCPTCNAIESQAEETVKNDFAAELESGDIEWKVLNYEEPDGSDLAEKFDVQIASVVLARRHRGQIVDWKPLGKVWALVADKPAFADYLRGEIRQMLAADSVKPSTPPAAAPPEAAAPESPPPDPDLPDIPVPSSDPGDIPVPDSAPLDIPVPSNDPPDIPVPDVTSDIPVPQ